jgi:class 3 adenylate cyclase
VALRGVEPPEHREDTSLGTTDTPEAMVERLRDQQRAVGDVLRAVATGDGLQAVLDEIAEAARRLCNGENAQLYLVEGDLLRVFAHSTNEPPEDYEHALQHPHAIDRTTVVGRVALSRDVVQIPDIQADLEYSYGGPPTYRGLLGVPISFEGELIGAIGIARATAGPFPNESVELVRTFADQAAIAIANARLLDAVRRQREELSHYLPSTVAELISSPDGARLLSAHRREITAVFCDIRGFTAFAEAAEPEEVLDVISQYQREMGQIVLAHGGTLEHYAGDGIMAFLNDPHPVPDHQREAVGMAIEMRDRFASSAERWARSGFDIGLGIGLSSGYATVGRVGFEGYYLYAAIGSVANQAARLCALAKPGQIVISGRTYAVVESGVTAEPMGSFELKGFRRPVEAYLVKDLVPRPAD